MGRGGEASNNKEEGSSSPKRHPWVLKVYVGSITSFILQSPLYVAAVNGHTAVVEILLKAGAVVNTVSTRWPSMSRFLRYYTNKFYSVVWVTHLSTPAHLHHTKQAQKKAGRPQCGILCMSCWLLFAQVLSFWIVLKYTYSHTNARDVCMYNTCSCTHGLQVNLIQTYM